MLPAKLRHRLKPKTHKALLGWLDFARLEIEADSYAAYRGYKNPARATKINHHDLINAFLALGYDRSGASPRYRDVRTEWRYSMRPIQ